MSILLPLPWFRRSFTGRTAQFAEAATLSVVLRLLALVSPFAMQAIIDRILPYQRAESLAIILVLLVAVAAFEGLLGFTTGRLGVWIGLGIGRDLALRALHHIVHLPLATLQKWPVGQILARISEIDKVQTFIAYTTSGLLLDAGFSLVYAAVLLTISPFLTAILLLAIPLQFALYFIFGPLERRRFDKAFLAGSFHNARLVESFSNAITLKSLGAEHHALNRLDQSLTEAMRQTLVAQNMALGGRTVSNLFEKALVAIVIFFGARLVLAHEITLGQLVSFHLLSGYVSGPILGLAKLWDDWQNVQIARRRVGELLLEPAEVESTGHALALKETSGLRLESVSFAYPGGKPLFHHLSAHFEPTGLSLMVGPSGCGKTTLARLIAGLLPVSAGEITFGGKSITHIAPSDYRRRVAYVPQTPELFNATIRENLHFAARVDDEACWQALDHAALANFVRDLPHGLDTVIGDGSVHLSGGQSQRLALARSLLLNPAVLILDEPTSALDRETEQRVMASLEALSHTWAIILITHRPDLVAEPRQLIHLDGNPEIKAWEGQAMAGLLAHA